MKMPTNLFRCRGKERTKRIERERIRLAREAVRIKRLVVRQQVIG